MQIADNPALTMRLSLIAHAPVGLLRWDLSGRALLVSDAPRRPDGADFPQAIERLGYTAIVERTLLYIDLPKAAYEGLLSFDFVQVGTWADAWFETQSLLLCLLHKKVVPVGDPDVALLRAAMLACAQGDLNVRAFADKLRIKAAEALRLGNTASCRACAALLAQWLWVQHGIGLPDTN